MSYQPVSDDYEFGQWDGGDSSPQMQYQPYDTPMQGYFSWQNDVLPQSSQTFNQFNPSNQITLSSGPIIDFPAPTPAKLYDENTLLNALFPPLGPNKPPSPPQAGPLKDKISKVDVPKSDLYRPRYVRKEGSNREGWCGYCEPGVWANLKHSNYSYHMLTRHGLSKRAIGSQLEPPQGLCLAYDQPNQESNVAVSVLWASCSRCGNSVRLSGNPNLECEYQRLTASWYSHAKECCQKGEKGFISA